MRIKRPKTGGFAMASHQGNQSSALPVDRRSFLKGAGGVAALGVGGALGPFCRPAMAQTDLRKENLKIPGVGKHLPTDADGEKFGELCLGPTKANVAAA